MIEATGQADSSPVPAWFETATASAGESKQTAGTHLLMGATAREKLDNAIRNLQEARFVVYQARAEKR